jgi:hypothetical protein
VLLLPTMEATLRRGAAVMEAMFQQRQRVLVEASPGEGADYYAGRVLEIRGEFRRSVYTQTELRVLYEAGSHCLWHPVHLVSPLDEGALVASPSGEDSVCLSWQLLPLRCCFTLQRLTDPARCVTCTHPPRCNHDALQACLQSSRACPVAGCTVIGMRSRDIVRDDSLRAALVTLPADAESCWLRGACEVRLEPPESGGVGAASHPARARAAETGGTRCNSRRQGAAEAHEARGRQRRARQHAPNYAEMGAEEEEEARRTTCSAWNGMHRAHACGHVGKCKKTAVAGVVEEEEELEEVKEEEAEEAAEEQPAEVVSEAEGLQLHLSSRSRSGYLNVYQSSGRFHAQCTRAGECRHVYLGCFDTAVEAAVAYARHVQTIGYKAPHGEAARGVAAEEEAEEQPGEGVREAEGLKLLLSSTSRSGYRGVYSTGTRFYAQFGFHGGSNYINLGTFDSSVEAAVAYARHVQSAGGDSVAASRTATDERRPCAVQSPDEVRHDGDGEEAEAAAAAAEVVSEAEGLRLHLSSRSRSGYSNVYQTVNGRFVAQAWNGWKIIYLDSFDSAVQAAVAYARHMLTAGGDKVGSGQRRRAPRARSREDEGGDGEEEVVEVEVVEMEEAEAEAVVEEDCAATFGNAHGVHSSNCRRCVGSKTNQGAQCLAPCPNGSVVGSASLQQERSAALDAREAALTAREAAMEAALSAREAAMKAAQAELDRREAAVAEREAALEDAEEDGEEAEEAAVAGTAAAGVVLEAEGLQLHPSSCSRSGYRNVYQRPNGRFQVYAGRFTEKYVNLGKFDSAVEGAVAYARHIQAVGGEADGEAETAAAKVNEAGKQPAATAVAVSESDGLQLHLSSNRSGYRHVYPTSNGRPFEAFSTAGGNYKHLGTFDSAVEAAVAYARHVQSASAALPSHNQSQHRSMAGGQAAEGSGRNHVPTVGLPLLHSSLKRSRSDGACHETNPVDMRDAKQSRQAAAMRNEDVVVDASGAGGIAARMRERNHAHERAV